MKMQVTKEVLEQYQKDLAAAMQMTDDLAQLNELNEIEQMAEHYDWDNQVFTDEKTGKKGLRGVDGTVLVPALYDEFPEVGSYRLFYKRPHVARQGDKYGIVAADGTGKPLTAFIYDSLAWDYLSPFYIAQWGGEKELKGLIFEDGQVLVPCVIKKLYARWNDLCCYDGEKLMGIIDLYRLKCTAPVFEAIDMEPESGLVTVIKDGELGVLDDTTLQFVPMSDYDEENGNYLHEEDWLLGKPQLI
jgi:hypothetical protein